MFFICIVIMMFIIKIEIVFIGGKGVKRLKVGNINGRFIFGILDDFVCLQDKEFIVEISVLINMIVVVVMVVGIDFY